MCSLPQNEGTWTADERTRTGCGGDVIYAHRDSGEQDRIERSRITATLWDKENGCEESYLDPDVATCNVERRSTKHGANGQRQRLRRGRERPPRPIKVGVSRFPQNLWFHPAAKPAF